MHARRISQFGRSPSRRFRLPLLAGGIAMWATLTIPSSALAQERTTRENLNAWATVIGDVQLTKRWFADYDVSLRTSGPFEEKMQFLPRLSVRYQPRPALRFNVGYNFVETWPYGKLPNAFRAPEHRMWEQVQLSQSVGRVNLTHRYRLEQRWNGRVALEDGEPQVQNWVRTNRFRYRLQGIVPLRGATLDDDEFYLHTSAELFLNWGANVQYNIFDQQRLLLLLGRRFSKHLRAEVGYMEHLIEKSNGRFLERNHTLVFNLYPSVSLVR